MRPDYSLIKELFDLPGGQTGPGDGSTRSRKGRNEAESRQLGSTALSEADYEAAVAHFQEAVTQSDGKSPWALMDLGAAYAATGDVPQAFIQYEKALRIQKSGELMVALGSLYQQVGRNIDAIDSLKDAVTLEPENAYVHFKLAEALRRAGHKAEALSAAQVAVACAPDQAFYHYWLAELLLETRRPAEAVDAVHAAIELSPGDDQLYLLAARALWAADRPQEAVRAIRLASDIDAENLLYRGVLEMFLRASGLTEEADQEAKKTAKMDLYDRESLAKIAAALKITLA